MFILHYSFSFLAKQTHLAVHSENYLASVKKVCYKQYLENIENHICMKRFGHCMQIVFPCLTLTNHLVISHDNPLKSTNQHSKIFCFFVVVVFF